MKFSEKRRTYLLILCIILLIITIVRWYILPTKIPIGLASSSSKGLVLQQEQNLNHGFGKDRFDPAIFINGPKLSRFETRKGKEKSLEYVRKVYSKYFNSEQTAETDEQLDTDDKPADYYLHSGLVPPELHFLWCRGGDEKPKRTKWFEYKHYLTVLSSLRTFHPDKVYMHFEAYPEMDRTIYNQWLDELKKEYPWLHMLNMTSDQIAKFCTSDDRSSKLSVIFELLNEWGGFFVGENTWMLKYRPTDRKLDFDFAFELDPDGTSDGYVMMRAGFYGKFLKLREKNLTGNKLSYPEDFLVNSIEGYVKPIAVLPPKNDVEIIDPFASDTDTVRYESSDNRNKNLKNNNNDDDDDDYKDVDTSDASNSESDNKGENVVDKNKTRRSSCFKIQQIYHNEQLRNSSRCVVVKGGTYDSFYPMDIWQMNDPVGRLCRKVFYGSERIRLPIPNYDTLVPNIGHMIWIGGREMDYVFYLSVLSMLFVAKLDVVYIHGDIEPPGPLWKELMTLKQTKDRIKFITRTQPMLIYQEEVEKHYYSLMSDLIRVDLMIKYGGVYTDTDAIWVKPLSYAERGYDAVASYDWIDWSWPFQDTVNFGISYGKRNAPFWKIFRNSMRKLYNNVHGFTGVMMPYKLLEKYPEMLRIDRRLSVICYHSKCHPTYFPGYHNERQDHTNTNSIPNWRKDVHAFHWTHPNPTEYFNRTTLLHSTGIFAELGRNVLMEAGLL